MTAPRSHRILGGFVVTALATAGWATSAPTAAADDSPAVPALGQQVAVASYIPPSDAAAWGQLTSTGEELDFVVANVANGPDTAVDPAWKSVIDAAAANGTKVLGYVDSGYFGFSSDQRKTVLGETDATSWLVQAQQDVNRWYEFYGSSIDGIFVDDGLNLCGPVPGDNTWADLYNQLDDYIHSFYPGALTVLNPGIAVPECYEDTGDILVTFEGPVNEYLDPSPERATPQWQLDNDPNKFWQIVYGVSEGQLPEVMDQSKINNSGYIYATPDGLPNPYDTVPQGSYWTTQLAETQVTSSIPAPRPSRPYAEEVYSTAVDIAWSSNNFDVAGYEVYVDGQQVGSVANYRPDDTSFAVIGLKPSTAYGITVRARTFAGDLSEPSTTRTVTTKKASRIPPAPPAGVTATNVTANGIQLTWQPSTPSDEEIVFYDVYENGVRKVSVPASVTSIRYGFLSPGTEYQFTVVARDWTGSTSPVSNAAAVTTPNPQPLESGAVAFGATTTTLEARYNLSFNFQNVFIDTDDNVSTGYQVGPFGAVIGADYLIQNGTFFKKDPANTGFSWISVPLVNGPLVSSAGGLYQWEVPSAEFGSGVTSLRVIFNGSGSSPEQSLPIIVAPLQ